MSSKNDKAVKLTVKQELFCREYVKDFNACAAMIRAGYSKNGARQSANNMLTKPYIKGYIDKIKAKRLEDVSIDAKYVLNRLVEIDQLDVVDIIEADGSLKQIKEWPKAWRISITGLDVQEMLAGDVQAVVKKIKWPDKLRNLELLGKHIDIKAWGEAEGSADDLEISKIVVEVVGANSID